MGRGWVCHGSGVCMLWVGGGGSMGPGWVCYGSGVEVAWVGGKVPGLQPQRALKGARRVL